MAFIAGTAAHINIDTALLYNWTALVFIGRPESVRTCYIYSYTHVLYPKTTFGVEAAIG